MLVLSRMRNESIVIGGQGGIPEIRVTVVDIRGDKVRLGLEAPKEIPINRKEVHDRINAPVGATP